MPTVGTGKNAKYFPYTPKGEAAAKKAQAATGMPMMSKSPMPMKPIPPTSQKPAVNPALAKLPSQAKGYGVRGTVPPKKGKK